MNYEEMRIILAQHKSELENFKVRRLACFGSVARNEAREDSDVDLLVDFEQPATFDRYIELKFYLEKLFARPVDLVTRRALKPRLRPIIEKEALYVT